MKNRLFLNYSPVLKELGLISLFHIMLKKSGDGFVTQEMNDEEVELPW